MALFAAQLQPWEEVSLSIQYTYMIYRVVSSLMSSLPQPWNPFTLISQLQPQPETKHLLIPIPTSTSPHHPPCNTTPSGPASSFEGKTEGQCSSTLGADHQSLYTYFQLLCRTITPLRPTFPTLSKLHYHRYRPSNHLDSKQRTWTNVSEPITFTYGNK